MQSQYYFPLDTSYICGEQDCVNEILLGVVWFYLEYFLSLLSYHFLIHSITSAVAMN